MKNPLGASPSKGYQRTTRIKKSLMTSVGIEPMTSGLDLPLLSQQSNGRSNPEVVRSIPTEAIKIFSLPRVVP